ncbi:MAG TPA: BON domain-containing protein [Bryobacteraceae bacterium]|nr:BON domain-containing protein [Bryobacteraceae bacterium]
MPTNTQKDRDEELRNDVLSQLEWDPQITAKNIVVSASDHVVTLSGFVPTYAERYAAEKAVKSVYGVEAIANDIEVKPLSSRLDSDIAHDVAHAMKINVIVPDEKIKAVVSGGFVTLSGTLDWDFQRKSAESCARNVAGVKSIINNIQVKPHVSSKVISSRIEEALRRNAELDARRITVEATDGKIYLNGRVRSWVEREEAERAAWAAPGVAEVVDRIAVIP